MALFNQSTPLSQYADTPDLLPYATTLTKRNGQATGIKKALDWLLPAVGAVAGTVLAPGVGTQLGASLGSAATTAMNRGERRKAEAMGATDALQNIDGSLPATLAAGSAVNLASSFVKFIPGAPGLGAAGQSVDPTADYSGALGAGVMDATGMTDYRNMLNNFTNTLSSAGATAGRNRFNFQLFADGGKPTPRFEKLKPTEIQEDNSSGWRFFEKLDDLASDIDHIDLTGQQAKADAVGRAGSAYVRNWFAGRPGLSDADRQAAAGVADPVMMRRDDLNNRYQSITRTSNQANGFADPKTGQYYVAYDQVTPDSQVRSVATHEGTHNYQFQMPGWDAQEALIRSFPQRQEDMGDMLMNQQRAYIGEPHEVHARIMQAREGLNLKPTDTVDQSHIDALKKQNSAHFLDLGSLYSDQQLIDLMNKVASNGLPDDGLLRAADGGMPTPRTNVAASSSTAVKRPYNRLDIPIMLPEVTIRGKRNANPFEAAGAQIGHAYVENLKKDPRYATSPWSVGSPADIIEPLIGFPGQVLDQATQTNQNAILKPSTVVDALTTADLKLPMAVSVGAGALLKKAAPHLKQIAREIVDPALEIGLRESRKLGAEKGWDAEQIARHQFENYGITDNQRKAYVPVVSDVLSSHVYPFGYTGMGNIKSKAAIAESRTNPDLADRFNAWDMYLGKPQKAILDEETATGVRKTFDYVGQQNGEDVLRFNNYQVPTIEPKDMPNIANKQAFVKRDTGGIMGGYGIHPMGGDQYQYRDRWDLHFPIDRNTVGRNLPITSPVIDAIDDAYPNIFFDKENNRLRSMNLKLENFIGKPFQSRGDLKLNPPNPGGQLPYLTTAYKEGGKSGAARNYTLYDDDDKTEDLISFDLQTGTPVHLSRYGERIYSQKATNTIDKVVTKLSMEPDEDGFKWLGKFIFDETRKHKDHADAFAGGGKPTPKTPSAEEIQRELQRAGFYSGPIDGKLTDDMIPLIEKYNKQPGLDKTRRMIINTDANDKLTGVDFRGGDESTGVLTGDPTTFDTTASAEFTYEKPRKSASPVSSPLTPTEMTTVSTPFVAGMAPNPGETTDTARYNWLNPGNVLNAARVVGGMVAANTPYPDEVDTSKLDMLAREAEGRREDGLSPTARRFAIDNLADNRSTAYEALRRNAGGGGSSGAVLAGIGQIGQTEVAGDVALGMADEQQRTVNRQDYRGLLGAQMDIANQRFTRQFGAAQATRQAGLNLIPQGIQGISDDYQYWKNYESPDSLYRKYMTAQSSLASQQAEAAKHIYGSNTRTFFNTPSTITPMGMSLTTPVATAPGLPTPTVGDYRQMFSLLPPVPSEPLTPYRRRNG